MKEIILIGDSICHGYFNVVESILGDVALLWSPEHGGGTTENTYAHMGEWLSGRRPDFIHINCGLHDLAQEFEAAESRIPITKYKSNVEEILVHLKERTDAHVIWALTTPVNETRHHENKNFDRFERYVTSYNDAALEVADSLHVPVNDLYSLVMDAGRDRLLGPDGVHFAEEGYELLGNAVADVLKKAMEETN